jgi:hypothetical protein
LRGGACSAAKRRLTLAAGSSASSCDNGDLRDVRPVDGQTVGERAHALLDRVDKKTNIEKHFVLKLFLDRQ